MAITISGTNITMNDDSTIVSTTTTDAIGSYGVLAPVTVVARGSTIAGTSLHTGSIPHLYGTLGSIATFAGNKSGTWRNMSSQSVPGRGGPGGEGNFSGHSGLFARVT